MTTRLTTLAITGMSCGSCAHHIDQALRAIPGVSHVSIDRRAQRAQVAHEATVAPDVLIEAAVDAGYGATQVAQAAT